MFYYFAEAKRHARRKLAWAAQGPYYPTAYIAKVIELTLIALLAINFVRRDGHPIERKSASG
jgi:hypothetical protein